MFACLFNLAIAPGPLAFYTLFVPFPVQVPICQLQSLSKRYPSDTLNLPALLPYKYSPRASLHFTSLHQHPSSLFGLLVISVHGTTTLSTAAAAAAVAAGGWQHRQLFEWGWREQSQLSLPAVQYEVDPYKRSDQDTEGPLLQQWPTVPERGADPEDLSQAPAVRQDRREERLLLVPEPQGPGETEEEAHRGHHRNQQQQQQEFRCRLSWYRKQKNILFLHVRAFLISDASLVLHSCRDSYH